MEKDVRAGVVWWFRRPEAVWGRKCEMECIGEFHLQGGG